MDFFIKKSIFSLFKNIRFYIISVTYYQNLDFLSRFKFRKYSIIVQLLIEKSIELIFRRKMYTEVLGDH